MREVTTAETIERFMRELGRRVRGSARIYFTGGATAVMHGWRDTTIDVDIHFSPELDELFRALPYLKESLSVNIELASPPDFIPPLPGWEDRSIFIAREGKLDFYHFDPYSQALAKIERGHDQDRSDVRSMFTDRLIKPGRLLELFEEIKPALHRYPAIDVNEFAAAVNNMIEELSSGDRDV
jgi:hypothetical protein